MKLRSALFNTWTIVRASKLSNTSKTFPLKLTLPTLSSAFLTKAESPSSIDQQRRRFSMTLSNANMSEDAEDASKGKGADSDTWKVKAKGYQKHAQRFTGLFAERAVQQAVRGRMNSGIPFPERNIRCLDMASGTGVAGFAVIDELRKDKENDDRSITMLATDLSPGMLEQVDAQAASRIHAVHKNVEIKTLVQDMTDLKDIPDGSVDICTLVFGIMCPEDPIQALREVRRILDPNGGVATIVSWSWNSLMQDMHEGAYDQGKIADMADFPLPYRRMGDEHSLRVAARMAGMKSVSTSYIQHHGVPIPISFLIHTMGAHPGSATTKPFNKSKLESFLLKRSPGEYEGEPSLQCGGTALCLQIGF